MPVTGRLASPAGTSTALSNTGASIATVQTYARTITTQPIVVGINALPDLGKHQQTAIDHANGWLDDAQPKILQAQTNIGSFANTFLSYYDPLYDLANKIVHGDKDQVPMFQKGLGELIKKSQQEQKATEDAITYMNTYRENFSTDHQQFTSDVNAAVAEIMGDDGDIATLNKKLGALNDAMGKDLMMIGFGATGIVVGVLTICVGALAEIPTAGASTAVVVAGVAIVAGGAAVLIAGSVELAKAQQEYKSTLEAIQKDKSAIGVLTTVKDQLSGFSTQLDGAISALQDLSKSWQAVDTNFTALNNDLTNDIDVTSPFLMSELDTAKKDWATLRDQVNRLQSFGDLPTIDKTVAELPQIQPHEVDRHLGAA